MHGSADRQRPRLWLIAGTGDGLRLALALQRRGWRLLVSVVSAQAALAYPPLPGLELRVGALAGQCGIGAVLRQAAEAGDPFQAVVDASHPFARQITADLARVWAAAGAALPPLLRLERDRPDDRPVPGLTWLPDLQPLAAQPLAGQRLLLAIGARQLRAAVHLSPGALHHARLPSSPAALAQGSAAGIAAERLACLRPGDAQEGAVLRALLRRWRIEVILCRQSGSSSERLWRGLAADLELRLLVLARPGEPPGLRRLGMAALEAALERLRQPASDPDAA